MNKMLNSFKHVNDEGEETVTTKSYCEDSTYVEEQGELGVILQDFIIHLTLVGFDKDLIEQAFKDAFE